MKWLNEPQSWFQTESGIKITSMPQTDFWRLTHDGGIRHNGHFCYEIAPGNFTLQSTIRAHYRDQYDQSGLMLRVSDTVWIKCGIELVDGQPQASSVVTKHHSDWAMSPIVNIANIANAGSVTFRIQRTDELIEISFGEHASDLSLMRQTSLRTTGPIQAGLMTASPKGDGFTTDFLDWELRCVDFDTK